MDACKAAGSSRLARGFAPAERPVTGKPETGLLRREALQTPVGLKRKGARPW